MTKPTLVHSLVVEANECQRCNHRWTSSFAATHWGFPLPPTLEPDNLQGYWVKPVKHKACFNCLDPALPQLKKQEPEYIPPPSTKASRPPARVASLDDILGD